MKSCFAALLLFASVLSATPAPRPYPILFVTQPPFPGDFTSFNAVFGNHHPDLQSSNRGGDLWVLYPNGHLKNLTAAAGYGSGAILTTIPISKSLMKRIRRDFSNLSAIWPAVAENRTNGAMNTAAAMLTRSFDESAVSVAAWNATKITSAC